VNPLERAAVVLGAGAAASLLLGIADRTPLRLIAFGTGAVIAVLVLAAAAVLGGLLGVRLLVVLAGAGFAAGAVLQVVQLSLGDTNILGGDGSTVGVFLGFAVGLLAVGLARTTSSTSTGRG
jgi:hypothetical protein